MDQPSLRTLVVDKTFSTKFIERPQVWINYSIIGRKLKWYRFTESGHPVGRIRSLNTVDTRLGRADTYSKLCVLTSRSGTLLWNRQECVQDFSLGAETEGPKAKSGGGVIGRGQQPPSHQLGALRSAVNSPAGFRAGLRPRKGFPQFSALRIASADIIILLIVDYHVAIGGQDPCPLAYAPGNRVLYLSCIYLPTLCVPFSTVLCSS